MSAAPSRFTKRLAIAAGGAVLLARGGAEEVATYRREPIVGQCAQHGGQRGYRTGAGIRRERIAHLAEGTKRTVATTLSRLSVWIMTSIPVSAFGPDRPE